MAGPKVQDSRAAELRRIALDRSVVQHRMRDAVMQQPVQPADAFRPNPGGFGAIVAEGIRSMDQPAGTAEAADLRPMAASGEMAG